MEILLIINLSLLQSFIFIHTLNYSMVDTTWHPVQFIFCRFFYARIYVSNKCADKLEELCWQMMEKFKFSNRLFSLLNKTVQLKTTLNFIWFGCYWLFTLQSLQKLTFVILYMKQQSSNQCKMRVAGLWVLQWI